MSDDKMASIFYDLNIDASKLMDNPKEFLEVMRMAASKLDSQLKDSNSLQSMEDKFRQNALKNKEANEEADEFINQITDLFSELSPETLCCILVRLPEVSRQIKSGITAMAMRQEKTFSKKRIHFMYNSLRKAYERYVTFLKAFYPEKIGNPPMIPARPGNYGNDSATIVEYIFIIDNEPYANYYTAARIVGVPINHYMDLVDAFRAAENNEINGHKIILKVIGEEE